MADETKQPWTPGPWEVFGGRIIRANDAEAGVPLAETRMPYRSRVGSIRASDEEHANAILMAAAPAMAEALALFIGTLEEGRGPRPDPLPRPIMSRPLTTMESYTPNSKSKEALRAIALSCVATDSLSN